MNNCPYEDHYSHTTNYRYHIIHDKCKYCKQLAMQSYGRLIQDRNRQLYHNSRSRSRNDTLNFTSRLNHSDRRYTNNLTVYGNNIWNTATELEDELEDVEVPTSVSELNNNSVISIYDNDNDNEYLNKFCPICQDDIEEKSIIRMLSCNHIFHCKCIDKWLETNKNCPLCNFSF